MSFVVIPKTDHLKKSLTKIAQLGSRCLAWIYQGGRSSRATSSRSHQAFIFPCNTAWEFIFLIVFVCLQYAKVALIFDEYLEGCMRKMYLFISLKASEKPIIHWSHELGFQIYKIDSSLDLIWVKSKWHKDPTTQLHCIYFSFLLPTANQLSKLTRPGPTKNQSIRNSHSSFICSFNLETRSHPGTEPPPAKMSHSKEKHLLEVGDPFFLKSFKEFSDTKWKPTLPSLHCHEVYGVH